jgi:hypothetical protein
MTLADDLKKQKEICEGQFVSRNSFTATAKWFVGVLLCLIIPLFGYTFTRFVAIDKCELKIEISEKEGEKRDKKIEELSKKIENSLINIEKYLDKIDKRLK